MSSTDMSWSEVLNGPVVGHLSIRKQWAAAWRYARRLRRWAYYWPAAPRPVEQPASWQVREFVARWDNNPHARTAVMCLRARDYPHQTRVQFYLLMRREQRRSAAALKAKERP